MISRRAFIATSALLLVAHCVVAQRIRRFTGSATTQQQSVDFYIDFTLGNDANDGMSPASAWKNIGTCTNRTFSAGQRIGLKCGETWTSDMLTPPSSGTASQPIVFTSYGSGVLPTINGNNGPYNYGVFISGKSNVVIQNLIVHHTKQHGLYTDGIGSGILFSNVTASYAGNGSATFDGWHMQDSASGSLVDCYSHNNGDDGYSQHGSGTWTVTRFTSAYNATDGLHNIDTSQCYVSDSVMLTNKGNGIYASGTVVGARNVRCDYNWNGGMYTDDYGGSLGAMYATNASATSNKYGIYVGGSRAGGSRFVQVGMTNALSALTFLNSTGIVTCVSNVYKGPAPWAVQVNSATNIMTNWFGLFVDAGCSLAGGYSVFGAVCLDSGAANKYNFRVVGGGDTNLIENCFINGSQNYAIRSDAIGVTVRNCAIRGTTTGNYYGYAATIRNCIGSDATIPNVNNNVMSANFALYYESTTATDALFAVPLVTGGAYETGEAITVSPAPTKYYNGVALSGTLHIGAMGVP